MYATNVWKAMVIAAALALLPATGFSAVPFTAPAEFDLTGSTISAQVRLETRLRGTVQASLTPNPTAVSGDLEIHTLDTASGAFTGALDQISATSTATVGQLGLTFPVTVTLSSNDVRGLFFWDQNTAVISPENITVTLDFAGTVWNVPVSGIPIPATYNNGKLAFSLNVDYADSYMGYAYTANIGINLVGTLVAGASSGLGQTSGGLPWLDIWTDETAYGPGDTLTLHITIGNAGPARTVDLYIALLDPAGGISFWPAYTASPTALPELSLTSGFYVPPLALQQVVLPTNLPPISASGNYSFLAAFTDPGTLNIVGATADAPFVYSAAASGQGAFDGQWDGPATIDTGQALCGTYGNAHFDIAGGVISGWGISDEDGYAVSGTVSPAGVVQNGLLWEEYGADLIQVGTFSGTFSGNTGNGTWGDRYGCSGTYQVTR